MAERARVGIDVGGTFTDLVALVEGRVVAAKVLSTPIDQSRGVMVALERAQLDPDDTAALAHGTTVATNALLERKGARTALVTTEGFRDVIEIGRQDRPALYDLTKGRPAPLVERDLRFTVSERCGPAGEIEPLDEDSVREAARVIAGAGVEAVAVCFLFSFLYPEHERRAKELLTEALDGVAVSLSSEVLPEFREYERFSTTAADAYLSPRLEHYLANLASEVTRRGFPAPLVMQSSGGVIAASEAVRRAAACVLSGPAGGVVGAAFTARRSGFSDVLTFDMGGTSTDVAPVVAGEVQTTTESVVAGVPLKLPMVDVHTVSAGGGSIARIDEGGALRVGPESAGAQPGPVCYGTGGSEPTVTDANLVLGYLSAGALLGGDIALDGDAAQRALEALGGRAGMSATEAALGVVRVANAEMTRALRLISVDRGLDPRSFSLVAFGGAGPMHACALAEELGMGTVLVPRAGGVLSALGLAISDVRRDAVRAVPARLGDARPEEIESAFADLEAALAEELGEGAQLQRRADLRYAGQSFELTVDASTVDEMADALHEAHERRYGYRMPDQEIELVNVRVVATLPVEPPEPAEGPGRDDVSKGTRRACFDGEWPEVPILERYRMGAGSKIEGPAIVEMAESTCVVRPGWAGAIDESGTIVLERG
jgi:N-methylhydantoinase A